MIVGALVLAASLMSPTAALPVRSHEFRLRAPHDGQRRLQSLIDRPDAKIVIGAFGRRWGKTTGAVELLLRRGLRQRLEIGWYAHVAKAVRPAWEHALSIIPPTAILRKSETEGQLQIVNGTRFQFGGLEEPDNVRGRGHDVVALDEGAMIGGRARDEIIYPMLADRNGQLLVFTTPKGKRGRGAHVYRDYRRGEGWETGQNEPGFFALRGPSTQNPLPSIRAWCEFAKGNLPEAIYRQEILAEFLDAGGAVFNLEPCLTLGGDERAPVSLPWLGACPQDAAGIYIGRRTIWGVDLAQRQDWTWIWALDAETGDCVYQDRFHHMAWDAQIARLGQAVTRFVAPARQVDCRPVKGVDAEVFIDATGLGGPVVERFMQWAGQSRLIAVNPVVFTSERKQTLIQGLQVATERKEVHSPWVAELVAEGDAFQADILSSGRMKYEAAEGFTDDGINAWALAVYGRNRAGWGTA